MILSPNNPRDFARIVHHLSTQRWGDFVFAIEGKSYDELWPTPWYINLDNAFRQMLRLEIRHGEPDERFVFPMLNEVFSALGFMEVDSDGCSVFDTMLNSRDSGKCLSFYVARIIAKIYKASGADYNSETPFTNPNVNLTYALYTILLNMEMEQGDNFHRIASAYFGSEYNPIENYSMLETRTPDLEEGYTGNTATDVNTTSESDGDVYGFNSTLAVPSSHAKTTTDTTGESEKNEATYTKTNTGTETLERSGNIGVTTSQQMLQSEIELRKYDFLVYVCKCFERVMFRQVYSCA